MKNFNNRYFCKNIHRYFTDIFDISVKSNYRYIRVYRYFDPWSRQSLVKTRSFYVATKYFYVAIELAKVKGNYVSTECFCVATEFGQGQEFLCRN